MTSAGPDPGTPMAGFQDDVTSMAHAAPQAVCDADFTRIFRVVDSACVRTGRDGA